MTLRIQDLGIDRELQSFLPALTKEEERELRESVERDGFTDPIITWLGHAVVVDGHHRLKLWKERGADPDTAPDIVERRFADKAAVMLWMMQKQFARRNLTPAQRAAIALRMKPALRERAKVAQSAGGGDKTGEAAKQAEKALVPHSAQQPRTPPVREQIAAVAHVSHDTVAKVETVLSNGSAKTKREMLAGTKSANAAFKETRKSQFNPSDFEDGPERTNPATEKQIATASRLLAKLSGDFSKVVDGLGPLVCTFDEIKAADASFGKRHKELLGHHSRLFQSCEEGKKALAALKAAWNRK